MLHNIGVGLLKDSTLMGTFTLPPLMNLAEVANVGTCNMISFVEKMSENDVKMDHSQVLPLTPLEIL